MTLSPSEQFRSNEVNTARLRELLNDPVLQEAVSIIKESTMPRDVEGEAIASIRALSKYAGRGEALDELIGLSIPYVQTPDEVSDFGSGLSQEQIERALKV